jgi:hypothetical protein
MAPTVKGLIKAYLYLAPGCKVKTCVSWPPPPTLQRGEHFFFRRMILIRGGEYPAPKCVVYTVDFDVIPIPRGSA